MTTPASTASSRACVTERPRLLEPSPDTSITRRSLLNGAPGNSVTALSIAPEIDVPPPYIMRGADSIAPANPFTVASSLSTVQGTTCDCRNGPDHCVIVTAID